MAKRHARPPGGGSVFQRKDGRWVAQVPVARGTRSVRDRKSLYASTQKEAERLLAEALRALEQGLTVPDPRLTVGEHLWAWLDWQRSRVRPSTWVTYEIHVRLHTKPLHRIPLLRLMPNDVRRWLMRLQAGTLSANSIGHSLVVLRMALKQAVDDGQVPRNAAAAVRAPEARRYEAAVLSVDQVRSFFASIHGDRLEALYVLAFATGLRQGELLGLRWEDVDYAAATLTVRAGLRPIPPSFRPAGDERRLRRVEPKTPHAYRAVPLPDFAVTQLRRHEDDQRSLRIANVDQLVFVTIRGTPIDGRNLTRQFQAALTAAGLPRIRFHDIRHSTSSLLRAQGLSIDDVQQILGHGSAAMTWRYTHVQPEVWHRATAALEEALG